jgi:hypothetical protein
MSPSWVCICSSEIKVISLRSLGRLLISFPKPDSHLNAWQDHPLTHSSQEPGWISRSSSFFTPPDTQAVAKSWLVYS